MAEPPPVALRTYTAIRMGVVVVIASLGWAVYREIANAPGHCVQRSLSAYYRGRSCTASAPSRWR
jgi:hypothetical protein